MNLVTIGLLLTLALLTQQYLLKVGDSKPIITYDEVECDCYNALLEIGYTYYQIHNNNDSTNADKLPGYFKTAQEKCTSTIFNYKETACGGTITKSIKQLKEFKWSWTDDVSHNLEELSYIIFAPALVCPLDPFFACFNK